MSHPQVRGVVVLARNGDRSEFYQDPDTYKPDTAETTPLGEVQSHLLGSYLRATYLDSSSSSHIAGMKSDLVDNKEIHVRVKAGGEGSVVFDSAIALLQGLFPPTSKNKMVLANETTVIAPLGGYQYVPLETVEPVNDRSLESWTDCPNFQKHVEKFYKSDDFKDAAKDAAPFFRGIKDFVFNTPLTLENMWNVHDFMSSQLMHNRSYAYRLPPTYIEQSQHWANFHEAGVFSDSAIGGMGHVASRTLLASILTAFQRIAWNGDPLQLFLQEVTYHSLVSLLSQTEAWDQRPDLRGLPNFASALAIELRGGDEGDSRSYLRFKFKNGTADPEFETIHVFGHAGDIPLTEFIYRIENSVIQDNKQWARVCGASSTSQSFADSVRSSGAGLSGLFMLLFFVFALLFARFRVHKKTRQSYVHLEEDHFVGSTRYAPQFVHAVPAEQHYYVPSADEKVRYI